MKMEHFSQIKAEHSVISSLVSFSIRKREKFHGSSLIRQEPIARLIHNLATMFLIAIVLHAKVEIRC